MRNYPSSISAMGGDPLERLADRTVAVRGEIRTPPLRGLDDEIVRVHRREVARRGVDHPQLTVRQVAGIDLAVLDGKELSPPNGTTKKWVEILSSALRTEP